ncbi:MAG: 1-acyl-sn-glycerol-3-phosphate acyltransferase, partial [Sedimenticolaceae bacterium]
MIFVRSLVYFVAMVGSVVFFGLAIALFGWFSRGDFSDVMATRWGRFNLWLHRVICGLGYQIQGLEHLPTDGPCIIMSKHQSTWETFGRRG